MDFITLTDINGAVHQVAPSQIVHVSPSLAVGASQVGLSNGFVIYLAATPAAFAGNIVAAIPTITIGQLPI
jgi:hypothetical protein